MNALDDYVGEVEEVYSQTFSGVNTNGNRSGHGGAKSRNWCFTLNNPVEREKIKDDSPAIKYIVYQLEEGASGTPHLQGFIQMHTACSMERIKKLWCNCGATLRQKCRFVCCRAHLEIAQARDLGKARDYCMKDEGRLDGPWEFGEWELPQQGRRSDIEAITEIAITHGYKRCAMEMPSTFVKMHRGLKELVSVRAKSRAEHPKICVLWGSTGTGKSHNARCLMPEDEDDYWVWDPSLGKWFQGYEQQKYVIFEEFRGQITFGQLLSVLDKYTAHVEYKGGSTKFVATRIVMTSPVHPKYWYESLATNDGQLDQLMRRLQLNGSKIIELTPLNAMAGSEVPQIEGW